MLDKSLAALSVSHNDGERHAFTYSVKSLTAAEVCVCVCAGQGQGVVSR